MRAVGCPYCKNTGYRRAFGVFELLETTPAIRRALMDRANSEDLRDLARESGYVGMFHDGLRRVFAGDTTIEALTEDVDTDESFEVSELVVA
jgi:type II secretory ATPase GspE/PulE/Tfp pilus assembly ATPase PilB-like protein